MNKIHFVFTEIKFRELKLRYYICDMVYLISDKENGYCKIGFSTKPFKRVHELKVGNSSQLVLEAVLYGDKTKEKEVHELFAHLRVNREWFFFKPEIKEYFNCGMGVGFDVFEMYPKLLTAIAHFTSATHFKVLLFMAKTVEENTIVVKVRHKELNNLAAKLGLGLRAVQISFQYLVENGIILKPYRGVYLLNPEMLFNGDRNHRILKIMELYDTKYLPFIQDEHKEGKTVSHNPIKKLNAEC